ncbi:hypothetical protein HRW14_10130 [Streptomyces lunaelactis]|uniref:hypothetical protein n=1 Tax=Streptomyces lunaelactis TaxID=1535768 RepID=UPI0015844B61|nr:hypothetical protein [Streptomyces lunaelactis]NUK50632.1 hypothetical protein [Streptomyces lunaelactis]NUK64851.1 hypothetical protein [Streptomyces lunaelactis]
MPLSTFTQEPAAYGRMGSQASCTGTLPLFLAAGFEAVARPTPSGGISSGIQVAR